MAHDKFRIPLPSMTPGSARHVVVHRFGRVGARPKVYLQAAVHANEFPGAMALHHLLPMLVKADAAGRIVGEVVGARLGRDAQANVALIRQAALAALDQVQPLNELQTLRVEVMKLSIDADMVLDLHCDLEAVLHLFISRRDWPGPAEALAADLGAEATLYNDPYPQALTFYGVNGALWARLAAA